MYRLANFSSRFGVAAAGRGPSIRPGLASALRLSVARRCFETEAMSLSTSVNIAPRLLSSKSMWLSQARSMGSASGETGGDTFLPSAEVAERIIGVLKAFDKVDASKVTDKSHFINDLGLDSLDAVEVVMAIEEEFVIEIPDDIAEKIVSVADAVKFVSEHPQAK